VGSRDGGGLKSGSKTDRIGMSGKDLRGRKQIWHVEMAYSPLHKNSPKQGDLARKVQALTTETRGTKTSTMSGHLSV